MREILFRGKMPVESKWVYGSLISEASVFDKRLVLTHIYGKDCNEILVDPETVGQYTGLTDKNGKKIFEGDILHLKNESEEYNWMAIVVFGNPNGEYSWGWQLQNITPNVCINPDILLWVETELNYVSCEVIGNIHDPELLGGEKNG